MFDSEQFLFAYPQNPDALSDGRLVDMKHLGEGRQLQRQQPLLGHHPFDVGVQTRLDFLEVGVRLLLLNLLMEVHLVEFASFVLVDQEVAMNLLVIVIRYSVNFAKGCPSVPTLTTALLQVF